MATTLGAEPNTVHDLPELTQEEYLRYGRHIILPDVGEAGQRRLKASRVLLIGAGGLGSPTAMYLAAAGVGTLGLVDFDVVDASNLQRQILHGTSTLGHRKVDSARDRLHDLNPNVHLETYDAPFSASNALEIARDYDVIVDGTDNFGTRYLTNDVSVLLGKPNVYGSIFRFEGQASVFATADGPCYRCLYPSPPPPGMVPSCAEGGVLGVLPGLIGTIQATETIKLLLGLGDTLAGRLLLVNTLDMSFRTVRLRRDPACPACGTRTITHLEEYTEYCGIPGTEATAAANAVAAGTGDITVRELAEKLARGDDFDLIDVREPYEWQIGRIPGARLIPLGEFEAAIPTLDPSREIVVQCRSGQRSGRAVAALQAAGFVYARNLVGGILAWSDEIDPTIPKY
ncbi:MAG TPA: molybdopterin-synthase adenylyltransferase MoeB [Gemmatimonadaceae bacterium]|nr:molybdopterin-synthase adenylyltransferase MoeB [Gemmatimonadaceae bacterium]